jgi:hypothetical protein
MIFHFFLQTNKQTKKIFFFLAHIQKEFKELSFMTVSPHDTSCFRSISCRDFGCFEVKLPLLTRWSNSFTFEYVWYVLLWFLYIWFLVRFMKWNLHFPTHAPPMCRILLWLVSEMNNNDDAALFAWESSKIEYRRWNPIKNYSIWLEIFTSRFSSYMVFNKFLVLVRNREFVQFRIILSPAFRSCFQCFTSWFRYMYLSLKFLWVLALIYFQNCQVHCQSHENPSTCQWFPPH